MNDDLKETVHIITMNGRAVCAVMGSLEAANERLSEIRADYYSRYPRERIIERTALYGTPMLFAVRTVPFYTETPF